MRRALRLLPLPLCIVVSLAAQAAEEHPGEWRLCPAQDAVPAFEDAQAPDAPATDRTRLPTDLQGDLLSGTEDQPRLEGNVALRRGDQFLGTNKLIYDKALGTYVAEGDVRYQDAGMRIVAERAEGNQGTDTHTIEDLKYQLVARRGNGGADSIRMHGSKGSLYGASYSTCPPDERGWELRAQRIDVDTGKGTGVAHNAVLRVGGVPVLYVPWFPFPIDERRRTGLLYPHISSSGRNGFDYLQPIYLNLAPNYDATLSPRIMSERGVQLGAQFRYLSDSGHAEVAGTWMPHDKLREGTRGSFDFDGSQTLSPNWKLRSSLSWVSDTHFIEDFSNNLFGISPYYLSSYAGLYGNGKYWQAGLAASHYQLADYTLGKRSLQYDQLPRAWVDWEQPFGRSLVAGVHAKAVRFEHPSKRDGSRIDIKPYLSLPLAGASWFITPTLAWRYTGYRLDDDYAAVLGGASPDRSLPILSLDAGLFFDRETSIGGESYLQTLEPRLFYLRVPYRDQSALPLFDTRPLTFSWGQLFRDNRYTGADRQTDANQLTLALSTRLLRQSDGREKLSASLGQIRYFDDSRVTVPGETPVEHGKSAWVADATYAINDRWSIGASYQWDPKFRRKDLASVRTRYLIGDRGVVNLGYRYRRNLLEQVDFNFLYPLNQSWSLVGRYYYSIKDSKLLEGIAGVQWDSCCVAVRLVGRRYMHNRRGELDNSLQLEVELKGLGSAGSDTESRLRRAILGYNREDLFLVPPSDLNDADAADAGDDGDDDTLPELMP